MLCLVMFIWEGCCCVYLRRVLCLVVLSRRVLFWLCLSEKGTVFGCVYLARGVFYAQIS